MGTEYKNIICENTIKESGTLQEQNFLKILFKLSWYLFKLDCCKFKMLIVIHRVATKKITRHGSIYMKYSEKMNP